MKKSLKAPKPQPTDKTWIILGIVLFLLVFFVIIYSSYRVDSGQAIGRIENRIIQRTADLAKTGSSTLPFALLDTLVAGDQIMINVSTSFMPFGPSQKMNITLTKHSDHLYSVEIMKLPELVGSSGEIICNNGIDDDNDGKTDCLDVTDCIEGRSCAADGSRVCVWSYLPNQDSAKPPTADQEKIIGCCGATQCWYSGLKKCMDYDTANYDAASLRYSCGSNNDWDLCGPPGVNSIYNKYAGNKSDGRGYLCTNDALQPWKPIINREICTNGIDDDGDTLIDCQDTTDCAEGMYCATDGSRVCVWSYFNNEDHTKPPTVNSIGCCGSTECRFWGSKDNVCFKYDTPYDQSKYICGGDNEWDVCGTIKHPAFNKYPGDLSDGAGYSCTTNAAQPWTSILITESKPLYEKDLIDTTLTDAIIFYLNTSDAIPDLEISHHEGNIVITNLHHISPAASDISFTKNGVSYGPIIRIPGGQTLEGTIGATSTSPPQLSVSGGILQNLYQDASTKQTTGEYGYDVSNTPDAFVLDIVATVLSQETHAYYVFAIDDVAYTLKEALFPAMKVTFSEPLGNEATTKITFAATTDLQPLALPCNLNDKSIDALFAGTNVKNVYAFDASGQAPLIWTQGEAPDDLTHFSELEGYFVKLKDKNATTVTASCAVEILTPLNDPISVERDFAPLRLRPGWNLVSMPGIVPRPLTQFVRDTKFSLFECSQGYACQEKPNTLPLNPGKPYWIYTDHSIFGSYTLE